MKIKAGLFRNLFVIMASLGVHSVFAADIRVHVVDRDLSTPLKGASVCLGTPANPVQFGGQFTAENGYAVFDSVPETPLLLTVSRADYTGYQRSQSAKRFDITLRVEMVSGGLGPQCELGDSRRISNTSDVALTVSSFTLNAGKSTTRKRTVNLNASVSGTPTHYRVAEHWSFDDAEWQEYTVGPQFTLSEGAGQKKVYFQVRKLSGTSGAQLESLSGIAQATVYLTN